MTRLVSMRIIVCVRQIIDPQTPAFEFKVDPEKKRATLPPGRKLVISDYDEVAVEAALRIKDDRGAEITALSLGDDSAREVLLRCLAMGADDGVLLSDPAFDDADSLATAQALAQAIKKLGGFDLILCGRQEGDWDAGQVGLGIAELLGIPMVSVVGKIDIDDGGLAVVERVVADGRDVIEMPLPALLTVSSEIGEPRYPPVRRVLAAAKQEIPVWNAQDIGYSAKSRNTIVRLFVPAHEGRCLFIEGETPAEQGSKLALKVRDANII